MKDKWSKFNEVSQNLIGLAVVAVYLAIVVMGKEPPIELVGFVAAVLFLFGFKAYKNGVSNTKTDTTTTPTAK
jgi:hypothetical protein